MFLNRKYIISFNNYNYIYSEFDDWRLNPNPQLGIGFEKFKNTWQANIQQVRNMAMSTQGHLSDTTVTTISSITFPGNAAFFGGIVLKDDRIFLIPYNGGSVYIYNTQDDTYITRGSWGSIAFRGGVLLKDDKPFMVNRRTGSSQIYDPQTDYFTSVGKINGEMIGGILLSDGNIFCVPHQNGYALIYNPYNDTVISVDSIYATSNYYGNNGLLLPNGNCIMIPSTAPYVREYNYIENISYDIPVPSGTGYPCLLPDGNVFFGTGGNTYAIIYNPTTGTIQTINNLVPQGSSFGGNVVLPDGRIFFVPHGNITAVIYDPYTDNITIPTGNYPGNGAFLNGITLHDGRIFLVPYNSTTAKIITTDIFEAGDNFTTSPFFNNF
jgi:glutamine cyclotransferase